jgi:hypothetical protein
MTTITYKDGGKALPSGAAHFHVASYAGRLLRSWRRWQTERQIESMPFEIRKDIGWPSADNDRDGKAM